MNYKPISSKRRIVSYGLAVYPKDIGGGLQVNLNTEGLDVLNTITFDFNISTNQLLYTVPNGKKLVVTGLVLREPPVAITPYASIFRLSDGAENLLAIDLSVADNFSGLSVVTTGINMWLLGSGVGLTTLQAIIIGAGGTVFIRVTTATGFAATCKADLLGYLIDA